MSHSPEIVTARLLLREVHVEDAPDVFTYVSNPNVLRYTTGTTPREISETETWIRTQTRLPDGEYAWSIRLKERSKVIGHIAFSVKDRTTGTVDYSLSEEYWNRGIMTEAVGNVLDWAFGSMPALDRVSSSAMTENPASTRVQQKCYMNLLRLVREKWSKFDKPVELAICAITREKWGQKTGS
jgi:[ribosomal protein S5]-alanine N-acetyltransferase